MSFKMGLTWCQPHQVHAVSQVCDLSLAGLDDPLDVVDARAEVCQLTLQLRFLLHDTNEVPSFNAMVAIAITNRKGKTQSCIQAVPAC